MINACFAAHFSAFYDQTTMAGPSPADKYPLEIRPCCSRPIVLPKHTITERCDRPVSCNFSVCARAMTLPVRLPDFRLTPDHTGLASFTRSPSGRAIFPGSFSGPIRASLPYQISGCNGQLPARQGGSKITLACGYLIRTVHPRRQRSLHALNRKCRTSPSFTS